MVLFGCCPKAMEEFDNQPFAGLLRIKKIAGFRAPHSSDPQVAECFGPG
jgi:hypothetical protein